MRLEASDVIQEFRWFFQHDICFSRRHVSDDDVSSIAASLSKIVRTFLEQTWVILIELKWSESCTQFRDS